MDKLKLIFFFFYLVALENPRPNREANEDDMLLDKTDFFDDTLVNKAILFLNIWSLIWTYWLLLWLLH